MEPVTALPAPLVLSKEIDQTKAMEKVKEKAKDTVSERKPTKEPAKDSSKGKGTSQRQY